MSDEEDAEEQKAQSGFHPRWSGRVRQSRDGRLAMARHLSLAAQFEVAAIRRVRRRSLYRAESSIRHTLQSPAKEYRWQHWWALVF